MARMTDIDELLEKVVKTQASGGNQEKKVGEIILAITNAPTVEVVRCKDCVHWVHTEEGLGDCTNGRFHLTGCPDPTMKMDDFCSCGERKNNG